MSSMLNNNNAIPKSENKVYVCKICFRTFETCQSYAGHFKGHRYGRGGPYPTHRHSRRRRASWAPYPLPVPRVPPVSARGLMINIGQGVGVDFVYAPNPFSVYNPFAHNYVAEGYLHAERYITRDFMGVITRDFMGANESVGSSERTFGDKSIEDMTKVGTNVNPDENVEEELDLELRL